MEQFSSPGCKRLGGNTRSAAPRRAGFSLVELLVVIAIIAVVASLILAGVSRARAASREVVCQNNLKQLSAAFTSFAMDHDGQLPGNFLDYQNPNPEYRAWLVNDSPYPENEFKRAPQCGTIYRYVNDEKAYLCPAFLQGTLNDNVSSNGRFDYASFIVFSGARLALLLGRTANFTHPDGRVEENLPVPLLCEEEPFNGINGGYPEGGHTFTDRIAHCHRGGGFYASPDGAVHWFKEPMDTDDPHDPRKNGDSRSWSVKKGAKTVSLGVSPWQEPWGWWNRQ